MVKVKVEFLWRGMTCRGVALSHDNVKDRESTHRERFIQAGAAALCKSSHAREVMR